MDIVNLNYVEYLLGGIIIGFWIALFIHHIDFIQKEKQKYMDSLSDKELRKFVNYRNKL